MSEATPAYRAAWVADIHDQIKSELDRANLQDDVKAWEMLRDHCTTKLILLDIARRSAS